MDLKAVGQRIKAAREAKNLTQEELAAPELSVNVKPITDIYDAAVAKEEADKQAAEQAPASRLPQRAFFQFYIIHSAQKGQASFSKMYTGGQKLLQTPSFLVNLQPVRGCLDKSCGTLL